MTLRSRQKRALGSNSRRINNMKCFVVAMMMTLLFLPSSFTLVEARTGILDAKPGKIWFGRDRDAALQDHDGVFMEEAYLAPIITTTSTSLEEVGFGSKLYRIDSTTTTTATPPKASRPATETSSSLAELAKNFEDAFIAMSQNNEDIHVGKLLSACERLGDTMNHIGFSQSARDIAGNVRKIKTVYDQLPKSERDSMPAIVRYELDNGVHGSGKHLKENSATMGFLWLGRSINYQYDMFSNMVDRDDEPYEAARRAYEADLKPHLSWPLQKVCQAAMTSLKSMRRESMFSKIGGFPEECYGQQEEQVIRNDLRHVMSTWKPMLSRWKQIFTDLELDTI